MRNKVCLTYIVSMAAFDQICCRRTVSVIASPERTQKEKMETQLYSFTRFLCLCFRELAIVLNYSWLLRCIAGNWVKVRPQNIPMVHCDTVLMAALETSMWLDITCNLQMAPWTQFFEVPVPEYNVDALNLATKVAPVPCEYVFCTSSKAFWPQPTASHIHTSMLLLRFNMAPEVDHPLFVNVLKCRWIRLRSLKSPWNSPRCLHHILSVKYDYFA